MYEPLKVHGARARADVTELHAVCSVLQLPGQRQRQCLTITGSLVRNQ